LADCATLPPLIFLAATHSFRADHPTITAYVERMLERPSVRETIRAAQPFFQYFLFAETLDPRLLEPAF
jgi:glutathione S-transferase